jgi:DNA-binding MarR family transcriptional regulator
MSNLPKRQHAVKRTAAGTALSELAVRVFQLEGRLAAAGDALAEPFGQTTARWRVLAAVEREPTTVADIARAWALARQSVQRVADLLERDGLVAYADNPRHARAKLVTLTASGRQTLAAIQHAQTAWANDLGARVGADELRAASDLLALVLDALPEG